MLVWTVNRISIIMIQVFFMRGNCHRWQNTSKLHSYSCILKIVIDLWRPATVFTSGIMRWHPWGTSWSTSGSGPINLPNVSDGKASGIWAHNCCLVFDSLSEGIPGWRRSIFIDHLVSGVVREGWDVSVCNVIMCFYLLGWSSVMGGMARSHCWPLEPNTKHCHILSERKDTRTGWLESGICLCPPNPHSIPAPPHTFAHPPINMSFMSLNIRQNQILCSYTLHYKKTHPLPEVLWRG